MKQSEEFATWLKQELRQRRLSQSELARMTGYSRQLISNMLYCRVLPGEEFLTKLGVVFDMPVENLYRLAGRLPHQEVKDSMISMVSHKLALIPPDQRQVVFDLIDTLLARNG